MTHGFDPAAPPDVPRRRIIDISRTTFLRILAAAALVWVWLHLWYWFLVFVAGAFVAVALDPLVQWMGRRGIRRRMAAPLVILSLAAIIIGFFAVAGASLAEEARLIGGRFTESLEAVKQQLPPALLELLPVAPAGGGGSTSYLQRGARALLNGLLGVLVALVFAAYLLLDGRRTFEWVAAFAPEQYRDKANTSALRARDIVAAYIRGTFVTSVMAAVATFLFLIALEVPAALLLALLAGVLNFVPVVGLFISAVPAVVLALTVSPTVALAVAGFYAIYNLFENYFIQPRVFGHQLRISDLAVIVAFLVGAELGGVLGAIVALPVAAMYPAVERIWFTRGKKAEVAAEHRQIEAEPEH